MSLYTDRHRSLCALVLVALCLLARSSDAAPRQPQVGEFSPQGTVKNVRQVVARFTDAMVPFGDPRPAVAPFVIDCPEKGTSRWVDSRTWVFDFARDLPSGVRCGFNVTPELKTLAGQALAGTPVFEFSTGGPAVTSVLPYDTESIDEAQIFVLQLDGPATDASTVAHAWFRIDGVGERVESRLITGVERDTVVNGLKNYNLTGSLVVLQARRQFPNGGRVDLVWGKGISSPSGIVTDQDQVFEFTARPAFTAQALCDRTNAKADCIPFLPLRIRFSAPVSREQALQVSVVGPDGRRFAALPPADEGKAAFLSELVVKGPFLEQALYRVELPVDLRDDAGRSLLNAKDFPLTVKTDEFPPLAKFSSRFGIVEAHGDPALPVTLRNVEPEVAAALQSVGGAAAAGAAQPTLTVTGTVTRVAADPAGMLEWLGRVADAKRGKSVFGETTAPAKARSFTVPKPNGGKAFEVFGIPLESPGLYIVELSSPRLGAALLGKPQPLYVPTAALVTNLAVHFKWSAENALAWVTTLDTAQPVANANVSAHDCSGKLLWSGTTDASGIAYVTGLPPRYQTPNCSRASRFESEDEEDVYYDDSSQTRALDALSGGVLIVASAGDDMSFVHSEWVRGIEPWRFQLPEESFGGPLVAHTVFDRTLLRAGDTVHMKHLIRSRTRDGFDPVADAARPTLAVIQHQGSDDKIELPLSWATNGSAESAWEIPKTAKLGTYEVTLKRSDSTAYRDQRTSGRFRVEEFRVPLLRTIVRLPVEPQVNVASFPVDITAQYLAGGAAANLPVVLRTQIRPKSLRVGWELEHFTFANGPVKEGVVRQGETDVESGAATPRGVHQRQDLVLDAAGSVRATVTEVPRGSALRELLAEVELRDPNGEIQTVASTVSLWPAQRLIGIRSEDWVGSASGVRSDLVVVDSAGKPVPGAPVRVEAIPRQTYSHRTRLVGGFYGYDDIEETGPSLGVICSGTSDERGMFRCEAPIQAEGNVIVQASTTDDLGNVCVSHDEVWIPGADQWWFGGADNDRIDVIPEKSRYEPGETAHLQVRMPFRQATGLVAIEREGIIEAHVLLLAGENPVVDVPIKDTYAPNVFVSVLAVRGRAGDVQPTATVDLGRPAFKLGIAEMAVGWQAHELRVGVSADRPAYQVREKAQVVVEVRDAAGKVPPPGSEVAIAAVDEGLLELQPNTSWDLLTTMMARRGYGVRTATAQMQVIGKRHYGLKALPQGGGGGKQTTRELFDTLLFWQAHVPLDGDGRARVEIPLNDSLTSFRIVAVATAGTSQYGNGATSIRSTQDLMLLSGLPPLVREGDRFRAEFTLRNASDRPMDVVVTPQVTGVSAPLTEQRQSLTPGAATVVGWDLLVPSGADTLAYTLDAKETGGAADRLRVTQTVRPAVPVQTYQATLMRWERPIEQPVARPADALPDRGGIRVGFAPKLSAGLDGVRAWMRDYPYTCLEQRVSRAVALNDEKEWQELSASLPAYLDNDGLLKYFPSVGLGSDVLTAYVLSITQAAGLSLPAAVLERTQMALRRFASGEIQRDVGVSAADRSLRKLAAIAVLARFGVADPKLLSTLTIEPNLWPTSAVLDWWTILRSLPNAPDRKARLGAVEQIVRARLNVQGTTTGFSTEKSDALWWLMLCRDTNALRLLSDVLDAGLWRDRTPQLMRGALMRQQRGAWDCTVSNAWGALAAEKFARTFEAVAVSGTSSATVATAASHVDWSKQPQGAVIDFAWPSGPKQSLLVEHKGTGSPWVTIQSRAAIPLTQAVTTGYAIRKEILPAEGRAGGPLRRGDVIRVRLEIDAQADMTWVVVNDPVPGGASHLGTGLARDSQIASASPAADEPDTIAPAFVERAFEGFRAYYDYVPKGRFTVEYRIRINQSGTFQLPPTRVEALYAPEMFGEIPNAQVEVQP